MHTLSHIALSNFLIPSLFSIVQFVVVYRSVNVLIINDIVLVNTMLAVFGVVFATVWAGNVSRREAQFDAWEGAPPTDGDAAAKSNPRAFRFPGLGSWHVATSPPTLTFGSTTHTVPSDGAGRSVHASGGFDSEKGNIQGMS